MTLRLKFPCKIRVRSRSAANALREISEKTLCDGIDPLRYRCLECECSWGDAVLTDYRMVTCSSCYSERVAIVCLRLSFENWGEQNGGEREQRERYSTARGLTAGLTTKTQVMDNTRLA